MTTEPVELSDDELERITKRQRPTAQARAFARLCVPYRRRLDGTLVVGREAFKQAMARSAGEAGSEPSNGLNWSKR